jgi:hypothetical protein
VFNNRALRRLKRRKRQEVGKKLYNETFIICTLDPTFFEW